jgi:hypothetical protein
MVCAARTPFWRDHARGRIVLSYERYEERMATTRLGLAHQWPNDEFAATMI